LFSSVSGDNDKNSNNVINNLREQRNIDIINNENNKNLSINKIVGGGYKGYSNIYVLGSLEELLNENDMK